MIYVACALHKCKLLIFVLGKNRKCRRIDVNSVKNTVFGKSLILIAEYDGPHGYSGSIEMKEWRFVSLIGKCGICPTCSTHK